MGHLKVGDRSRKSYPNLYARRHHLRNRYSYKSNLGGGWGQIIAHRQDWLHDLDQLLTQ